jgi:hypothetical protein
VGRLRTRQSHSSRTAEGNFLFGDEDRRVAPRFDGMLRIFGGML